VTDSSVKEIIGSQTSLPLFLNELNDKPGIHIYDGESDEDFKRLGSVIGKERLHLSAGCAAFAPYLAEIIGFERRAVPPGVLKKGLIVLSGSLHPVTIAQVGYSEQKGMKRYTLSAEQKVHLGSDTQKREAFVSEITDTYTKEGAVLIDVGTETVADQRDSGEPVKDTIAHSMGELFKSILDEGVEATYMCIGGDTLQALFRVTGISAITPVREVLPGVVLARFVYQGKERLIITKSGGFGTENVIELLWNECKGSGA